jgi:hypothetical protein
VPENKKKRKRNGNKLPWLHHQSVSFDFLTAGLRNQRTGSEEPLVSVISQAQKNLQFFLEEPTKNCRFLGSSSFIIPPYRSLANGPSVNIPRAQLIFPSKPKFCNLFEFSATKSTQKSLSSTP